MNRNVKPVKTKEMFARDLKISSANVLGMALFTLVNVIMIIAKADRIFPFCASVPTYLTLLFAELCGMRSEEFYENAYDGMEGFEFMQSGIFWAVVAVAVVMVAIYFVLWYFAKKKKIFSTILMIAYAIDTLGLLVFSTAIYAFDFSAIIDLAFHAWVFYYLILSLKAWDGMEYAPSEAELARQYAPQPVMTQDVEGEPLETTDEVVSDEVTETVSEGTNE